MTPEDLFYLQNGKVLQLCSISVGIQATICHDGDQVKHYVDTYPNIYDLSCCDRFFLIAKIYISLSCRNALQIMQFMWKHAVKTRRKLVGGIMVSMHKYILHKQDGELMTIIIMIQKSENDDNCHQKFQFLHPNKKIYI